MARFKVYYQDENQCSVDEPVDICIEDGLTPEAEHQAIIDKFREEYPNYEWECIQYADRRYNKERRNNMDKQRNTAAEVLKRVEEYLDKPESKFRIDKVYDDLSIFDWWPEYLSKSNLRDMRQFLKEAIKLGYEGYVCFKVGARGCANGMWAHTELETDDGYAPNNCPTLFRSFTPAYRYWDVTDKTGDWDFEGKYESEEDRRQNYDRLGTIKELEAFIEAHRDQVYRK